MNAVIDEKLIQLLQNTEFEPEPQLLKLVKAATITENTHLQKQVRKLLEAKIAEYHENPFNTTPSSSSFSPRDGIALGECNGRRATLEEDQLTRHLLAVGQSGSGKTTLFYNLVSQLDKPFWAFDLKQDYRHLLEEDGELLVLPWSELKFNPLKPPPGVMPRRWAQVFVEMFGHSTSLLSASKNYLLKQTVFLYKLYGLFVETGEPYPSLHELETLIKKDRLNPTSKTANYRDTVLNRIEAMNLVAGTIFDCSEGYPIEELLQRNVVFEFDGLSRDIQNFLMETLFAYVYTYRVAQNHRNQGLQHVFLLDEGKRVFSVYKERQDAAGLPEIDELTAKMREFGEGLIVGDQEATKLTDSIKANTYTKFLLPSGDYKQFQAIAQSLNLTTQQKQAAYNLDIGEAVLQTGNQPPVRLQLDNFHLNKDVSDKELQRLQAENWEDLDSRSRETTPEYTQVVAPGRSEKLEEPEILEDPTNETGLSSDGKQFLEDLVENPFTQLTERYEQFPSTYKGNKAKNEVVDAGLAIERNVKTGQGKRKLLQLTKKGRKHAENTLGLDTNSRGRGGIVHQYWQHHIKHLFKEAGWAAELETYDADVYVQLGFMELVIEIAMGNNPREIEHVEKHLERGFDTIWILTQTKEIQDGLRQRLEDKDLLSDRVVFRLLRDLNTDEIAPK
ncbi:ATP-binding protein [Haloferax gibbonsii]|uniref:ATP-binding protein n=1 Tax=Haloferax gibbonsii TaxID=35746 RepID=UPI000A8E7DED|nr:ATP-binding protein [Haloferax gibbonsii]